MTMIEFGRSQRRWLGERYRWGSASHTSNRFGTQSIHLQVFPPGIPPDSRRYTRLALRWPLLGTMHAVLAAVLISVLTPMPLGLTILVVALAAGYAGALLAIGTAPIRHRTARLTAKLPALHPEESEVVRFQDAAQLLEGLELAEDEFDAGKISWDEYRRVWQAGHERVSRAGGAGARRRGA